MATAEELDQASQAPEEEYISLGLFRNVIVGIRYYDGEVGDNEMVKLVREPENAYDRNAIRVENIQGEKVGHLKREVAAQLAQLLDADDLRIEGIMPGGKKSAYNMPIVVYCFGRSEQVRAPLKARLAMAGCRVEAADLEGSGGGGSGAGTSAAAAAAAAGGGSRGALLSPVDMQSSLDRMFEEMLDAPGPVAHLAPPPGCAITSALYPHQQQALAWMVERENSNALAPFWEGRMEGRPMSLKYVHSLANHPSNQRPAPLRGGILADDMGLGKTLTVLALLAVNRPGAVLPAAVMLLPGAGGTGTVDGEGPNGSEEPPAKRQKKKGKATADAKAGPSLLAAAKSKGAAKLEAALAQALPAPTPPAADGPRGTLIVCPLSVLSNWATQLEEHTDGSLNVYTYHGPDRNRSPTFLATQDVVITTYATLAGEQQLSNRSGLLAVQWLRVVLDEAHTVKNAATQQAKAARALKAERRWAVTGTPIQNRMQDLFGLLSFLKVEMLDDRSFFRQALERPLKQTSEVGLKRLQVLLGSIALRRTKDTRVGGRPLVELPTRTVHIAQVDLCPADQAAYSRMETEGQELMAAHLEDGSLLSNYTHVLTVIMRLRQICDSASLCPDALASLQALSVAAAASRAAAGTSTAAAAAAPLEPAQLERLLAALAASGEDECAICLSSMLAPCITRCAHVFCRRCIETVCALDKPSCPMCRSHISPTELIDPPQPQLQEEGEQQQEQEKEGQQGVQEREERSAKVAALMAHLTALEAQVPSDGGPHFKSVVFSQFVGMLDLVGCELKAAGIPFVRLDGSTPQRARAAMLQAFASPAPDAPRVFLATLKAGGVGMNLVAANQVHLLDPWWNPATEEQAMDRVHRLGQTRPVDVWRYVARGTLEERMLALQERKRNLASAAFDVRGGADAMRNARIEDIRLLMDL